MEIKEIKQKLDIETVVKYYGYTPDRNHLLNCPFHQDKTPSLQLYPKTGTWHCFGCGRGNDGIDFIELHEKCTKHQAILKAGELSGDPPVQPKTTLQQPEISDKQRTETLTLAFGYFARSLQGRDRKPFQYLQNRSLDPAKLTVGYDSRKFHTGKLVTEKQKQLYLSCGLLYADKLGRKNSYHSFFGDCVVFPLLDKQNRIISLYGRCIDEEQKSHHRYLPGGHRGLYPGWPGKETVRLILTESVIDAATLQQHPDITETYTILACYGTNNLTADHRAAIKELSALQEVIFFYDGDQAGKRATVSHAELIRSIHPNVKLTHIETPEGEDINSLAQGHDSEIFTHLLKERKPVENFSFNGTTNGTPQPDETSKTFQTNVTKTPPAPAENDKQASCLNTDEPDRLIYESGDLVITLWGGINLKQVSRLRVTLHIRRGEADYRDTADLYSHSQSSRIIREAGSRLETGTTEMTRVISSLTSALEDYRRGEQEKQRKREEAQRRKEQEVFSPQELQAGLSFLKSADLMERTVKEIEKIGLVGEENKGLLLHFILLTRMFKEPLHALVQGQSGSGKTYLLKKITGLVPKRHIHVTTALTENTLYHGVKDFWKHRILLIEDLDGAFHALLPLRELMSSQSISKMSTLKNMRTGEFQQRKLGIEGPVCVAGATTKDRIYEDNANRSFLIRVNESPDHEKRVLDYQRRALSGLLDRTGEERACRLFKSAQMNLEPLEVVIPFGEKLKLPERVFKKLRTNAHYLTLIKSIAFWHQKQRKIRESSDGSRYIEAAPDDVAWANRFCRDVLLRKSDELSGGLRSFFEQLKKHLRSENRVSFYAGKVRSRYRMHPQQLKRYLDELCHRGYIRQTGGNRKTGFEYEVRIWNDYELLQQGTDILDKILEELRNG